MAKSPMERSPEGQTYNILPDQVELLMTLISLSFISTNDSYSSTLLRIYLLLLLSLLQLMPFITRIKLRVCLYSSVLHLSLLQGIF